MGAGILGLSAAWAMAQAGARVQVLDRAGTAAGASGGLVGALAPHVPEQWNTKKALQFDSLLMADAFWDAVAAAGGIDPGFARTGRVQPLPADMVDRARQREIEATTLWRGQATWRVVDKVPGLVVDSPSGLYVHDTLSGRINPRAACAALAAAIRASGGTVGIGTRPPPGSAVVWATGVQGLADLGAALSAPMGGPVKGQAALLAADWRDAPQLFVDGLHVVPHADGTVAVGSTSERDVTTTDTDARLDALIDRTGALVPALANAPVLERWAGLRPRSPSRAPMLGPWPGRPGHFVLNGGFKIGFGMAPVLAGLIADLVLTGRDRVPAGFRVTDNLKK